MSPAAVDAHAPRRRGCQAHGPRRPALGLKSTSPAPKILRAARARRGSATRDTTARAFRFPPARVLASSARQRISLPARGNAESLRLQLVVARHTERGRIGIFSFLREPARDERVGG